MGLGLGVLLLAAWGPAAAAQSPTPQQVIQETADQVIAVLRQGELPLEERRRRIEEIADGRFDNETMSRLVLARHWRRFTPDQRARFVAEMKRHVIVNYGDRIDRYDQQGIEILGQRPEARGDVTVRTRLTGGEADGLQVDYRMRMRGSDWYVIDVVVEGVSIVKSYRSQFQKMLSNGSPETLLAELAAKNDAAAEARAEATETAEDADAVSEEPPPAEAEPAAS